MENVDLLDIEEVDFTTLDKGVAKVQRKLHKDINIFWMLKLIKGLGREEVAGAGIYVFYTCLTHWDFDKNSDSTSENLKLVPIASQVGRNLINKYLFKIYLEESGGINIRHKVPYGSWRVIYLWRITTI